MKTLINTITGIILFCYTAASQPVILRDSGFILISNDSVAILKDMHYVNTFSQPRSNGIWDISTASYQYPIGYVQRQAPPTSAYPTASYVYSGANYYSGLLHFVNSYCAVDSFGIAFLGQTSLRQNYSLSSVTGDPTDRIIFPLQTISNVPALKQLVFPATIGSSWSNSSSSTTQTIVYSKIGNLVDTPMTISTRQTSADSIIGWGKMRVRMPDSTRISDYEPVLQVQEVGTKTDSFWIAGAPVPDSILNYLGLVQGATDTSHIIKFLRTEEIEPLLTIFFVNPNFSLPVDARVVPMRLVSFQQTGIPAVSASDLHVYPNPTRLRDIMISWKGAHESEASYILTSFEGRNMATGTLHLNKLLHLPESLPAGIYCLTILQTTGNKISVPLSLE